jgi:hypothetical protein
MASQVQICNLALIEIGAERIQALTDASQEARECNAIYDLMRDELLEGYNWPFARGRATLAQNAEGPDFGYEYSFALPGDCLRALSVKERPGDASHEPIWTVEGRDLLTDLDEINLRYIKKANDPGQYPPSFVRAFALKMAAMLAMSVAKSKTLAAELDDKFIRYIEQEAMKTAARTGNEPFYLESTYVQARSSGVTGIPAAESSSFVAYPDFEG